MAWLRESMFRVWWIRVPSSLCCFNCSWLITPDILSIVFCCLVKSVDFESHDLVDMNKTTRVIHNSITVDKLIWITLSFMYCYIFTCFNFSIAASIRIFSAVNALRFSMSGEPANALSSAVLASNDAFNLPYFSPAVNAPPLTFAAASVSYTHLTLPTNSRV